MCEFLAQHRVGKVSLVPGTAYMEFVRPIVVEKFGSVPFELDNIQFHQILFLDLVEAGGEAPVVHVELEHETNAITIESEIDGVQRLHAAMQLHLVTAQTNTSDSPFRIELKVRGAIDNLQLQRLESKLNQPHVLPEGKVLVRVCAVGLNFRDVLNVSELILVTLGILAQILLE